ncbi:CHRD domain-containing protein, partial [Candidatus Sumerlaeota bacterium]|nr:CHRD domain-containing protein [Candidatus Sumerlaeota bacterium]
MGVPLAQGMWAAVWSTSDTLQFYGLDIGSDGDVVAALSNNEGLTWDDAFPFPLASTDSGADTRPTMVTNGGDLTTDTFILVWESTDSLEGTKGTDSDILFSRLAPDTDGVFTTPTVLTASMLTDTGEDHAPQLLHTKIEGQSVWIVVWYSNQPADGTGQEVGTDNDIFVSVSLDEGHSWTPPRALNNDAATDTAEDTMPRIAASGDKLVAVWESKDTTGSLTGTDTDLRFSRLSPDTNGEWTTPSLLTPSMAADSGEDLAPQILGLNDQGWIVAWHSNEHKDALGVEVGTDYDIFAALSSNPDGSTWFGPIAFNSNAATDFGDDLNPSMAFDGNNFVIAWQSNDTLGNTKGPDFDILISVSGPETQGFTPAKALNSNACNDYGDDLFPHVSTDKMGNWLIVWQSNDSLQGLTGTDFDIGFSNSSEVGPTPTPSPTATESPTPSPSPTETETEAPEPPTPTPAPFNPFGSRHYLNVNALTDAGQDLHPKTVPLGGPDWITVWSTTDNLQSLNLNIGNEGDIVRAYSNDEGTTWGTVLPFPGEENDPSIDILTHGGPPLARLTSDSLVVVWEGGGTTDSIGGADRDIYYSYRTPGNLDQWTTPTVLLPSMLTDTGDDHAPQFVRRTIDGEDFWLIVWSSNEPRDLFNRDVGTDYDIFAAISLDQGATWIGPLALNSNAMTDTGDDEFAQVETDGQNILIVWQSQGFAGADKDIVFSSLSPDSVDGFTTPALLTPSMATDTGDDANPQILSDGHGGWFVVWESNEPKDLLGQDKGADYDLFFAFAADPAGTVWNGPFIFNTNAYTDTGDDRNPRMAFDGTTFVLVWDSNDTLGGTKGADHDILFTMSGPNTNGLTAPAPIDNLAYSDTGEDLFPHVDTDHAGNWVVVWQSNDTAGGANAGDYDICYVQSSTLGPVPTPTPSPTPRATASPVETESPTATETPTETATPSPSDSPSPSPTPSVSPTPSASATPPPVDCLIMIASLEAAQVTGGLSTSTAAGFGVFQVDRTARRITFEISMGGLAFSTEDDVTTATIRGFAAPGFDSSTVLRPLEAGSFMTGVWDYVPADEANILAGLAYVDIRTTQFPGGEIRGQIILPAAFGIELSADQVVPPSTSTASGLGLALMDPVAHALYYQLELTNFTDTETTSSIHGFAGVGANAPERHEMPLGKLKTGAWIYEPSQESDILAGLSYVLVQTTETLTGALRGQIVPISPLACVEPGPTSTPPPTASPTPSATPLLNNSPTPSASPTRSPSASPSPSPLTQFTAAPTSTPGAPPECFRLPRIVNTNAATDGSAEDSAPQVATDGRGHWVAVWQSNAATIPAGNIGSDFDILAATSENNGNTWSAPRALNSNAFGDSQPDTEPQIATDGLGTWIAVWSSKVSVGGLLGNDGDILYARSTDNGATWSFPAALNSFAAGDTGLDANPRLAADGEGNWFAVWTSNEPNPFPGANLGTDNEILYSRSADGGLTWSQAALVHPKNAVNDSMPSIAAGERDQWIVVWQSTNPQDNVSVNTTDLDILTAAWDAQLNAFGPTRQLNHFASFDAATDESPRIVSDRRGNWLVAWDSDYDLGGIGFDFDILCSRSSDNGGHWSEAAPLNLTAYTDARRQTDTYRADKNAVLETDGRGTWMAAWVTSGVNAGISFDGDLFALYGGDEDLLWSKSVDNGFSWSGPEPLNIPASSDAGASDAAPAWATDGKGFWMAVWASSNPAITPPGNIGADKDILFTAPAFVCFTPTPTASASATKTPTIMPSVSPSPTPSPVPPPRDVKFNCLPVWLNTNAPDDQLLPATTAADTNPSVAADGMGRWIAVWSSTTPITISNVGSQTLTTGTDGDILFSRSIDGETWTPPSPLNLNAANDSGADTNPQIATDGSGHWIVVWESAGFAGADKDLLLSRSDDNGMTWSLPQVLTTSMTSDAAQDVAPSLATDKRFVTSGGTAPSVWGIVWEIDGGPGGGSFGPDADLAYSFSSDNGVNWSAPVPIESQAFADSDNDARPQIAADGSGNWVALWETAGIGGDFDIVSASLSCAPSCGAWSAAVAVNDSYAVSDTVAQDRRPRVAYAGSGRWVALWTTPFKLAGMSGTDNEIFYAVSTSGGSAWSSPRVLNSTAAIDGSASDINPHLASDGQGTLVAVWQSNFASIGSLGSGTEVDQVYSVSTDAGISWSGVLPLNQNALLDTGSDQNGFAATDGHGNWIGVWNSTDTINGKIGTDQDILFTTTMEPCPPAIPGVRDFDLTIANVEAQTAVDPQPPSIGGTVKAEIKNQGRLAIEEDFTVSFFEDRNRDDLLNTQLGDKILAETIVTQRLDAGATVTVTANIPAGTEVLFRDNLVHAMVDSANAISEFDETNNVTDNGRACQGESFSGAIEPKLKLHWDGDAAVFPEIKYLITPPLVIDLNQDRRPEIVFPAWSGAGRIGKLFALHSIPGTAVAPGPTGPRINTLIPDPAKNPENGQLFWSAGAEVYNY